MTAPPAPKELSEKCKIKLKDLERMKKDGKCIPKEEIRGFVGCLSQQKLIEGKDRRASMSESWTDAKQLKCKV